MAAYSTMGAQMHRIRRFFETHHGGNSPLVVIQQFVRAHGLPDPLQVKQLAQQVALPEAAVRGAITYYSDLHQDSEGTAPAFALGHLVCWPVRKTCSLRLADWPHVAACTASVFAIVLRLPCSPTNVRWH